MKPILPAGIQSSISKPGSKFSNPLYEIFTKQSQREFILIIVQTNDTFNLQKHSAASVREGSNFMYKLLIVDDEQKIREVIREYAEFNEYEVEEASEGMEALNLCKNNSYDLIIMDIMMPKLDGFSACKELRKFSDTPVIMLSARDEEYDKLFGFELGIDDYVTKPFSPKELMARIHAVLSRRNAGSASQVSDCYKLDGLEVNMAARTVTIDGVKAELTPKEYELLFYLVQNRNLALSRDKLLSDVWGYDFFGDDRTIDTHIKNLRNNLGPYRDHIVTLRGVGYKFEE